jgi:hypothetical protein
MSCSPDEAQRNPVSGTVNPAAVAHRQAEGREQWHQRSRVGEDDRTPRSWEEGRFSKKRSHQHAPFGARLLPNTHIHFAVEPLIVNVFHVVASLSQGPLWRSAQILIPL